MSTSTKITKGSLVQLNDEKCFTVKSGGGLEYPLTNYRCDEEGIVIGFYKHTRQQRDEWYKDLRAAIKAGEDTWHDDGGEPRIAPLEGGVNLYRGRTYIVLRARVQTTYNYHKRGGLIKLLDTATGQEVYVDRTLVIGV